MNETTRTIIVKCDCGREYEADAPADEYAKALKEQGVRSCAFCRVGHMQYPPEAFAVTGEDK